MQKDNCKEPLHNHHDGCPSCNEVNDVLAMKIMFKDQELEELRALKAHTDRRIELLEHRCSQYSRLSAQHVKNLQKKNDEIWDLKYTITTLKDELKMAEKFNKMQS